VLNLSTTIVSYTAFTWTNPAYSQSSQSASLRAYVATSGTLSYSINSPYYIGPVIQLFKNGVEQAYVDGDAYPSASGSFPVTSTDVVTLTISYIFGQLQNTMYGNFQLT
jgi:hypothetical protein